MHTHRKKQETPLYIIHDATYDTVNHANGEKSCVCFQFVLNKTKTHGQIHTDSKHVTVCVCVCPNYLVKPLQPLLWRSSQDTVINTHDRELIALCQTMACQLLMAHTH